jgi:hypothetical protein
MSFRLPRLDTKQPIRLRRPSVRLAAALWLVLAVVVWNVVFDRILVLAGRRYSYAASMAAREGRAYLRIDDWMRPAVAHGVRIASVTALAIAVFGLIAVAFAARIDRERSRRAGSALLQQDFKE